MLNLFARARRFGALTAAIVIVFAATYAAPASADPGVLDPDAPVYIPGTQPLDLEKLGTEELLLQRDIAFITRNGVKAPQAIRHGKARQSFLVGADFRSRNGGHSFDPFPASPGVELAA